MVEELIKLPTETYSVVIENKNFDVKPIGEKCESLLRSICLFGGSVRAYPNEESPTSIFVKYKPSNFNTIDVYNYQVTDVEMEMHLNLLQNQKDFEKRIKTFMEDCSRAMKNQLPEKSSKDRKKWVQVINAYEY